MTSSRANCAPRWDGRTAGRRVTVMGLGRFGGGIGAVRWLVQHGATVTVTDRQPADRLTASLAAISDLSLAGMRFGEHRVEDFTSPDLVVASPAIRPDHPCLQAARAAGVPVTTEVAIFIRHCPARIVGVTGSVGKSTTAALIHHWLAAAGVRAWLGGNLGGSLLDSITAMRPADWVVLELSSFQLQYLDNESWSPEIAVVTNFAPNHLDWHTSLQEYRHAKQTLLRWQSPTDTAVLNGDDPDVQAWETRGLQLRVEARRHGQVGQPVARTSATSPSPQLFPPRAAPISNNVDGGGEGTSGALDYPAAGPAICEFQIRDGQGHIIETCDWPELPSLPGQHNRRNAALALAAVRATGVPTTSPVAALATYRPLPHRLEYLGEVRGRQFYNDSKATTPQSAIAALLAFDRPVVLLAGGSDKGVDLRPFADVIRQRTRAVALLGATGPGLDRWLATSAEGVTLPDRYVAGDFPAAFRWAVEQSQPGDVVLLSPGCASFGWFRDYEDRGEQFRTAVKAWADR